MRRLTCILCAVLTLGAVGCSGAGSGQWACTWETRHSSCGGGGYTAWKSECYAFWEDDYYITPQQVCSNLSKSDTSCSDTCCIYVDGRNASLARGTCP